MHKAIVILVTLLLPVPALRATPPQDPILAISQRLVAGDVDGAREAFRWEVISRLEFLEQDHGGMHENRTPFNALVALNAVAHVINIWQQSELMLARKGPVVPSAIRRELFGYAVRMEKSLERIEDSEAKAQSKGSSRNEASFNLYREPILDTLRKTLAMSRGAVPAQEREDLWKAIGPRLGRSQDDLRVIDTESSDLYKVFDLDVSPPSRKLHTQPPPSASRIVTRSAEPGLFEMLERLYRAVFDGDVATVESLAAPGAVTPEVVEKIKEFSGGKFQSLGSVYLKDVEGNRFEVRIDSGKALSREGQEIVLYSTLLLKKTESGTLAVERF